MRGPSPNLWLILLLLVSSTVLLAVAGHSQSGLVHPLPPELLQGEELTGQEKFSEALAVLQQGLSKAEVPSIKARYLALIGWCHLRKGKIRQAEETFRRALKEDPRNRRAAYGARQAGQVLSLLKHERQQPAYSLGRFIGSAAALKEKVLMVHCFIRPRDSEHWKPTAIQEVSSTVKEGERWVDRWRRKWNVAQILFAEETLVADRIFPLKLIGLPDRVQAGEAAEQAWVELLIQALGFPDSRAFVKSFRDRYGVRNVAILLHVDFKGRSFARRHFCPPGKSCPPYPDSMEYAICYRDTERPVDPAGVSPYIHEMFHLFGADDLYAVAGAEDYYPDDLMHEWRLYPEEYVVSPLTAYAVGWTPQLTEATGFKVEEGAVQPETEVRR